MSRAPAPRALSVLTCLVAGAALLAGCSGGGGGTASASSGDHGGSASSGDQGSRTHVTRATPRGTPVCHGKALTDVVRQVEPGVVTIRTPQGLGSGVVYRRDMVLTDQHVVAVHEGQPQTFTHVQVALADGATITGKVVGSDLTTDLAVVQVTRHLPALTFRTSLPQQGETVLAVGSPLGFSSSVTEGIVSALGRDLPSSSTTPPLVDLIQTDAPISPGNSGGALVDVCGHVVGINEAYIPPSSGAVALGFATPSVVATSIADQLIAHGVAQHPFLGVNVTNLTPDIARSLGTSAHQGVVVVGVVRGGPADRAGIQRGDVIVELAGHAVTDYADLLGELRTQRPGAKVPVKVNRRGQEKTFTVTIGSRAEP
ncbi:MAG TPA: trypsin-like peptidase domain-containing protein [Marmoricola sp.]|nr:trypsin-like peptidase domain-containing protein [Marmoricola sp.]